MKKCLFIFSIFLSSIGYAQENVVFYFDNNKFELNKIEADKLQKWIKENPKSKILSITGSTDEVGSTGYNDTLSQKRVNNIYNLIKGKVAIREDFKSISLGEKVTQSKVKAENRKAIIHFLQEKDLAKENEIIGIKTISNEIQPIEEEAMNFPPNATLLEKIELSKPGTKILLKDILFYQNTFAMLPESNGILHELTFVMLKYPKLKIEIQGHICCVDIDRRNLSLDRAKQVRRFLEFNEVEQSRVKVKGFGTTKPKFPIPEANEEQAKANRRVEIMILEK